MAAIFKDDLLLEPGGALIDVTPDTSGTGRPAAVNVDAIAAWKADPVDSIAAAEEEDTAAVVTEKVTVKPEVSRWRRAELEKLRMAMEEGETPSTDDTAAAKAAWAMSVNPAAVRPLSVTASVKLGTPAG
jgi:hypothetical protein